MLYIAVAAPMYSTAGRSVHITRITAHSQLLFLSVAIFTARRYYKMPSTGSASYDNYVFMSILHSLGSTDRHIVTTTGF